MRADLRTYIIGDTAIAAVISTRLYPEVALHISGSDPYAVYTTLSSRTMDTHNDVGLLMVDLVDLSIFAPTITEVYNLAELLRIRLSNVRTDLGSYDAHIVWRGLNTSYSDDDELYSASITLEITWS